MLLKMLKWGVRIGAAAALITLIVDFGFRLGSAAKVVLLAVQFAVVGIFALDVAARFVTAPSRRQFLRSRWIEVALVALLGIEAIAAPAMASGRLLTQLYVVGAQAFLVANIVLAAVRANDRLTERRVRPAWLLLGSYVLLIGVGTGLLLMPRAHAPEKSWSFVDALFTSTSAACVTGLTVRDTGTDLSIHGQAVVLGLIQIGGLGLATLAILASFFQQRALKLRQMALVRDLLSVQALGNLGRFLAFTLGVTLLVELAGAALLYEFVPDTGDHPRIWWSVFHSVSAFCNAGFGLSADSLSGWSGAPGVLVPIMALIVVGGLGFPVIADLMRFEVTSLPIIRRWRWRLRWSPWGTSERPLTRLSLHTRLVVGTTVVLLVAGAVLFYVSEIGGAIETRGFGEGILASVFQSVSARTAGFNTLDIGKLQLPTLMLLMILMGVGASPVSTGGGVKTSTVAVLFLTVRSMMRGRERVEAFGRSIPRAMVNASVSIAALYGTMAILVTALLTATQPGIRFVDAMFESLSALSTVGLSTGVTAQTDSFGRLVLCGAMLIGRVGPLAIMWTIVSRPPALRYEYPEESVLVS